MANRFRHTWMIVLVALVAGAIGTYLLIAGHAATPSASLEADQGVLSGGATVQTSAGASNGSYVRFGPAASPR